MSTTYAAIDVETTGLNPERDDIIELAVIIFRGEEILDEFSSLINPQRAVPGFITRLTGISQAMVDDAPTLFSLRGRIRALLAGHILVGHNVGFDLSFLQEAGLALGQQRLDTLTLAAILLPQAGRHSLDALTRQLNLPRPAGGQAHRALGDARQTVDLFLELSRRARQMEFETISEIVAAGQKLGWPETLFFEEALRQAGRDAFGRAQRPRRLFKPAKLTARPLVPAEKPEPIDIGLATDLFKPGGNLNRHFPDFEYRPQQIEMVEAVAQAFNQGEHLIVEAGTGTGKSIGYLLPAAFWAAQNKRRVVISTNTINLQDQLIHKDLPALQPIFPFEIRAAVLKGKRNYLCTRLFQQMRHSGPNNADEMSLYARLLTWLPVTESGDAAELNLRGQGERMAWARLSAENDSCSAEKCAEEGCPLHYARRRAEQAHILVVNHALLLADVASENRVLPEYLDLVVDEAHHLEAAVTDGLSFQADKRFLEMILEELTRPRAGLAADLQNRLRAAAPPEVSLAVEEKINKLREQATLALTRLDEFFMTVDYFLREHIRPRSQYAQQVRLVAAIRQTPDFQEVILSWENLNKPLAAVSEGFALLAETVADLSEAYDIEEADDLRLTLLSNGRHLNETRLNLDALIANPSEKMIYWIEFFKNRTSLHAAPLHIGPLVEKHIFESKETVILTSATLRTAAPGGNNEANFAYLRSRLNADQANELAVGSPFNYEASTLLFLPTDMPEPNQPGYQRRVEEAIVDLAIALGGRTMVLFTSYGQLSATARAIEQPLNEAEITLLAQGEGGSRQQLLEQFKAEGSRAVLLGTRSFWEGVDVPGPALQAVMIAKFPFDVPSDPVFAARSETFDSPFFEYSIPEAALRFRQGFGRLIRRQSDEGIVVVLDKRVLSKRYGQAFLDALPNCVVLRQRIGRLGELARRWLDREKAA